MEALYKHKLKAPLLYRVQGYKVSIVNPRWPPKIQDGRHEIKFFDISTSDGGDFLPIIEIALLLFFYSLSIIAF